MRIALVACRPHRYAGRMLAAGEVFYVKGQDDARVLTAIGAARYAPAEVALPVAPPVEAPVVIEPPPAPPVPDELPPALDPTPEPEPTPAPAPEPAPEDEPARRRRYRRRDLEAEDTSA